MRKKTAQSVNHTKHSFSQETSNYVESSDPIKLQVTFEHPNVAYLSGNDDKEKEEGWWTMIYNVGFLLRSPSYEFFGIFAYQLNEKMITRHDCVSFCDKVVASYYKDLNTGKLGCFSAKKIKLFEDTPKGKIFSEKEAVKGVDKLKDIKYEDLSFLVESINKQTYFLVIICVGIESGRQNSIQIL